jgi:hypothetical protein
MEAAGLPQCEHPFYPSPAFVAAASLAAVFPQDSEADHPFGGRGKGWRLKTTPVGNAVT